MTDIRLFLIATLMMTAAGCAAAAESPTGGRNASDRIFVYGLWGGVIQPYEPGWEGLLRDLRRRSMNCLICAPAVYTTPEAIRTPEARAREITRLKQMVDRCRRYGIYVSPYVGIADISDRKPQEEEAALRELAEAFRDDPMVVGWYIRDEPPPEFLPEFRRIRSALESAAPRIPAYCNFYRPDSVAAFAPHQRLMVSDQYPVAYAHSGTSLGPHFAVREGPLKVTGGAEQFNMWGNRGVLEWMDLCAGLSGGLPHWIILQDFESGNSHRVRWRQPTVPEIRLQSYLALAGGATGILHFIDTVVRDPYGNSLPTLHGEYTSLYGEMARLGAELTPLGPLLIEARVNEPFTVVATLRPTPDPGNRIEIRRLHSRTRPVDYLIAFNNDILTRSTAQVHLSADFLADREIWDLHALEAAPTEAMPRGKALPMALEPGGGRVFAVASEADFRKDQQVILQGRCQNEAAILELDYDLAEKSGLDMEAARQFRDGYRAQMASGAFGDAQKEIRRCAHALQGIMRQDALFKAVRHDLQYVRETLGRLGGEPAPFRKRLSAAYRGLLGLFWEGQARTIRSEIRQMRAIVEQIETAALEGPEALNAISVDEKALSALEARAKAYRD